MGTGAGILEVNGVPGGTSTVTRPKSLRTVEGWRQVSYTNCFGPSFHAEDWVPERGWEDTNKAALRTVYDYYGRINAKAQDQYHWMGLAKPAGATVVGGLNLSSIVDGQPFVAIAKAIFEDVAWQFEAHMAGGMDELDALLPDYDAAKKYAHPCHAAWVGIDSGGRAAVDGSHSLLEHEQKDLIQPGYDKLPPKVRRLLMDPLNALDARKLIDRGGAFTPCPHPYGEAFIVVKPTGDLFKAEDRWDWIERDMWPTWAALPQSERRRIIDLDFSSLVARNFGPLLQQFLPPGSGKEDED